MSQQPLVTEEVIARQTPEAQSIIRLLLTRIAEQDQRIATLEAELSAFKKTPQNSSLPPSTQHPHAKPTPKKLKSKRKRSGQPGHPKHERELLPTDQCDNHVTLKPEQCRRSFRDLAEVILWHTERTRESFRGNDLDSGRDLSSASSQQL